MDHCLCPWWLWGWEPWKNRKWRLHALHPRKQELRLGVPFQRRDSTHNRLWVIYYWPIRSFYSNFWPIRSRQTTEECPDAIIMQCVQSIVGVIIQECKHVKTSAKIKKVFSLRDARHFEIFSWPQSMLKWFKGSKGYYFITTLYEHWKERSGFFIV